MGKDEKVCWPRGRQTGRGAPKTLYTPRPRHPLPIGSVSVTNTTTMKTVLALALMSLGAVTAWVPLHTLASPAPWHALAAPPPRSRWRSRAPALSLAFWTPRSARTSSRSTSYTSTVSEACESMRGRGGRPPGSGCRGARARWPARGTRWPLHHLGLDGGRGHRTTNSARGHSPALSPYRAQGTTEPPPAASVHSLAP